MSKVQEAITLRSAVSIMIMPCLMDGSCKGSRSDMYKLLTVEDLCSLQFTSIRRVLELAIALVVVAVVVAFLLLL